MPGLIDMHVHIEKETGPGKYLEAFTMNNAREAVRQPYKNSADWITKDISTMENVVFVMKDRMIYKNEN